MMNSKLIFVDDEEDLVKVVLKRLSAIGFEIEGLFNIQSAIDYISNNEVDLIISDMRMPHGYGIEIIKFLKENNKNTPVIFVTAYSDSHKKELLLLGAKAVLTKPINFEELLVEIKKNL